MNEFDEMIINKTKKLITNLRTTGNKQNLDIIAYAENAEAERDAAIKLIALFGERLCRSGFTTQCNTCAHEKHNCSGKTFKFRGMEENDA